MGMGMTWLDFQLPIENQNGRQLVTIFFVFDVNIFFYNSQFCLDSYPSAPSSNFFFTKGQGHRSKVKVED